MLSLIKVLEDQIFELRAEYLALGRQYEALEEYADTQERRADALRMVIDEMIDRSGAGVRRDLMDSFNEVAADLSIDLELSDTERGDGGFGSTGK